MPILPAVPGLMRLDLDWETQVKNWTTAFKFLKSVAGLWSAPDMDAVLSSAALFTTGQFLPRFGPATTSTGFKATDLSSPMGMEIAIGGSGAGTGAGTSPLPINCALKGHYPPGMRYRGGRPGQFWGGLDEADLMSTNRSMWSNATTAAWISAIENFVSNFVGFVLPSGQTCNPVYVSYFTGHAVRPVPLVIPLTGEGIVVQQRVCSRRKRLGKGVPGE